MAVPRLRADPKTASEYHPGRARVTWALKIPIDLPQVNKTIRSRYGWAVRKRQKQLTRDWIAVHRCQERWSDKAKATGRRRVTFIRVLGPRQRKFDDDNLSAAFKPIRDALTEESLIVDDDPRHIEARYEQVDHERTVGPEIRIVITEGAV